jgi:alkanesulfonate monooxygenase SsuD/methylene tetrahydromethanopterin reductase-like flavin-dependent oxidoreductase (luciferase family)
MQLGATLPVADIGTGPTIVRDYAQAAEELGYSHLLVGDHVLGAIPAAERGVFVASAADMASRHGDYRRVGSTLYAFHDPFVLFGFLTGYTQKIGFAVGVLILAQRQAALVAKQAASLDILCGGRFRLGVGVGWNEIEFIALNPRPASGRVPIWFGGDAEVSFRRAAKYGDGFMPLNYPPGDAALAAFEKLRTFTQEAGRDPSEIGLEVWVSPDAGRPISTRASH